MGIITTSPAENADWRKYPLAEMARRTARFEEAVWAAQIAAPPNHALLKQAVGRRGAERPPVWLRRVTPDLVIRYGNALIDLYKEFPDDLGRVSPYDLMVGFKTKSKITPTEAMMLDSEWISE